MRLDNLYFMTTSVHYCEIKEEDFSAGTALHQLP